MADVLVVLATVVHASLLIMTVDVFEMLKGSSQSPSPADSRPSRALRGGSVGTATLWGLVVLLDINSGCTSKVK